MATLSSPTLTKLLVNVRSMLNQPDRNNSFWTDEELTTFINDAISVYFTEVTHFKEGLFNTATNLNITTDTETVSLPSDCFQIRTLYRRVSNGYEPLAYMNETDAPYSTQGGSGGDSFQPAYFLRGNSIVLRPTPNFSETSGLRLEYVQFPETLVNGGDTLTAQISPIFKQLLEMYAVYKAKLKETLVTGTVVHKHAEDAVAALYLGFKAAIAPRSLAPTYVQPWSP
jgi:hypothetical protein